MAAEEHLYKALHDLDIDDQHSYHTPYLHNYAACTVCGNPTRDTCILCQKPHDSHCLFNIHLPENHDDDPPTTPSEWGPEPVETYEWSKACLACYTAHENHPPYSWGWSSHRVFAVSFDLFFQTGAGGTAINKGFSIPAGDMHSWVSDPTAAKLINIYPWVDPEGKIWPRDLDAFETVSLLSWMGAWQEKMKQAAQQASEVLVRYHNKSLEAAREADRGFIDYSQYE